MTAAEEVVEAGPQAAEEVVASVVVDGEPDPGRQCPHGQPKNGQCEDCRAVLLAHGIDPDTGQQQPPEDQSLLGQARVAWSLAAAAGQAVDEGGATLNRSHWAAVSRCAALVPALHDAVLHLGALHVAVAEAANRDAPLPPSVIRALAMLEGPAEPEAQQG